MHKHVRGNEDRLIGGVRIPGVKKKVGAGPRKYQKRG